jgi:hypothetical protein
MNELITVRTFSSSSDFQMVKVYLESFGIECFTKDEVINRAYLANVNGGVKLQVREEQLEDAIRFLKEGGYLTEEDLEPSPEFKWIDNILSKFRKKD